MAEEDPDESAKNLDPWDDELLLYYLSHGKFIQGSTKKNIKRVTNKAPHFKLENNRLFYKKNMKDETYKEWPVNSDRKDLILRAHLV